MRIETPDAVTQEILISGFKHIAEEMAVVEYRSSYSPIIREMLETKLSERQGRVIDHDGAGSMEEKKKEGYF